MTTAASHARPAAFPRPLAPEPADSVSFRPGLVPSPAWFRPRPGSVPVSFRPRSRSVPGREPSDRQCAPHPPRRHGFPDGEPPEHAHPPSLQGVPYGASVGRAQPIGRGRHAKGFERFGWSGARSGTSSARLPGARTTELQVLAGGLDTVCNRARASCRTGRSSAAETGPARRLDRRFTALTGPEPGGSRRGPCSPGARWGDARTVAPCVRSR